jgi:hypothetical protein
MPTMNKIVPLLASTALLSLSYAAAVAAESPDAHDDPSRTAVDEKRKQSEPAECPIKKTIDGKTYCFQNDPALTKRQGGG